MGRPRVKNVASRVMTNVGSTVHVERHIPGPYRNVKREWDSPDSDPQANCGEYEPEALRTQGR